MSRSGLPLTPASSTDIRAKEYHGDQPHEHDFALPSPAMESIDGGASMAVSGNSDSSYHAASPKQGRKRRRASSSRPKTSTRTKVSLPPPPSRARKIIQMNPGGIDQQKANTTSTDRVGKKDTQKGQGKSRSQTVAGKKTARKTAHSIIERRRRSKMNEEFETLKGMVPACRGQTMHKLSILQAGIEYMRYLERCVTDLKTGFPRPSDVTQSHVPSQRPDNVDSLSESSSDDEDYSEAETAGNTKEPRSSTDALPFSPLRRLFSKAKSPDEESRRQADQPSPSMTSSNSHSSMLPTSAPNHRYGHKSLGQTTDDPVGAKSTLVKDAIQEADQEATAALLMLNSDRRYRQHGEKVGGGLRIKDLLSA